MLIFVGRGVEGVERRDLIKVITTGANGSKYVKSFWKKNENKPVWWPRDVKFISPNRRPSHGKLDYYT